MNIKSFIKGHNNYVNNGKGFGPAPPVPPPAAQDIEPPVKEADAPVDDEKAVILDELRYKNNYNPAELDLNGADTARCVCLTINRS